MKRRKRDRVSGGVSKKRSPPAGTARGGLAQNPLGEGLAPNPAAPSSWRLTMPAAGLIVLAAVAAYWNSFGGPFAFDDATSIVENPTIRQLWPIWPALSPPCNGETVSGRPLLNLSLAINYALGGLDVRGYHATNLAIHIAAALLLFDILRRTLRSPVLRERFGAAATPLALASALLWAVHPLHTESVTYIAQRAESLAGFFYLLTLYCAIRGTTERGTRNEGRGTRDESRGTKDERRGAREEGRGTRDEKQKQEDTSCSPLAPRPSPLIPLWYAASVLACLLGMATKEVLVTAPLIVLLYDRTFLSGSFREALRRRWGLYVALAATWGLLIYLVSSTGLIGRQPELGAPDPWSYARMQPAVILHYLRLAFWPHPLCLDYAWPVADTLREILPAAIVVGLLAAATLWGLIGRKAWGFLGAWFLLILAPSSSILPLGQLAFEHRVYLSLAAVVVLVVAGGYTLWGKLLTRLVGQGGQPPFSPEMALGDIGLSAAKKGPVSFPMATMRWAAPVAVGTALAVALGCATARRNSDYRSLYVLYQETVATSPHNFMAHHNLALALAGLGRTEEAVEHYRQSLRLRPEYAEAHNGLGLALASMGDAEEAIEHYQQALQVKPGYAGAHNNLGLALAGLGRTDEAIAHYHAALRLDANLATAHNNLGVALAKAGKGDEAIEQYLAALRIKADFAEAHINLAEVLNHLGRSNEAVEHCRAALRIKPDFAEAEHNLGTSLARLGNTQQAIEHFRRALRLKSDYPQAHNNLGTALLAAGRAEEAMACFNQALRIKSDGAEARNNLGLALAQLGKHAEAIEQYQQALRIQPNDADANHNLAVALTAVGRTSEAIDYYQRALRLRPDFAKAQSNLGGVLAMSGRTQEAIEHYRRALQLEPDCFEAHSNLGLALAGTGKTDEAIAHCREALRIKADYVDAHNNLGLVLAAVGSTGEAVEHYDRALRLRPDFAAALSNLAWLLATRDATQGGDPGRAVRLAERLRALPGQDSAHCLDVLAAAYAAAGRFADAVTSAEKAQQLADSTGPALLASLIRTRLELYRAGRPYREGPRSAEHQPQP